MKTNQLAFTAITCLAFLIILGVVFNDILKENIERFEFYEQEVMQWKERPAIELTEKKNVIPPKHFIHIRGLEYYNLDNPQTGEIYVLEATRISEDEVGFDLVPLK